MAKPSGLPLPVFCTWLSVSVPGHTKAATFTGVCATREMTEIGFIEARVPGTPTSG